MAGFDDSSTGGISGTSTIDDDLDPSVLIESADGKDYIEIDTTDDAEKLILSGGSTEHGMIVNKYGCTVRMSMGATDAAIANSTAGDKIVDGAVFLDESSAGSGTHDTLVMDFLNGSCGAVTLTHDIAHIRFRNAPTLGTAHTITVKITNNGSAAKEIDWASSTQIYSDAGTITKNGSLHWSGGVKHTMSTGTSDIDIVQFTCMPTAENDRDIYCCVIGQDFQT